ncbi:unnamed protein product [Lota lota]
MARGIGTRPNSLLKSDTRSTAGYISHHDRLELHKASYFLSYFHSPVLLDLRACRPERLVLFGSSLPASVTRSPTCRVLIVSRRAPCGA